MARTYAEKTIKLLFGAARRCAYPDCDAALVFEDRGVMTVVAQIAHIRSEKGKGPRYDASYPGKINSPENLLLLCGTHHKPVDEHASIYPVDELLQWKAQQIRDGIQREVSDQDVARIVRHYELTELGPEGFFKVCQALAARVFGPDPEPDRRRRMIRGYDAAFLGRAAEYPSAEAPWEGFMILEGLFSYNPLSSRGQLIQLRRRITDRFDAWFKPDRKSEPSEYVVIATNNSLAAAHDGGDSVLALLEELTAKHGLKAVKLWDEGRIADLLGKYPDIHDVVSAMTTSHVLLSNMLNTSAESP